MMQKVNENKNICLNQINENIDSNQTNENSS